MNMTANQHAKSASTRPGLYLRAEGRSNVQFDPVLLASGADFSQARGALDRVLERLYAKHGIDNVEWYIERSLGTDVDGKVAWCNLDLTDCVVH